MRGDIKFVDFHTHLDHYKNKNYVIETINNYKVISVSASIDIESYLLTKQMAQKSEYIIPTFGIHPMRSKLPFKIETIDKYLLESNLIGEIGLDNLWFNEMGLEIQKEVFEYILDHCNLYKKYCVIHTKSAEQEVLDILLKYKDCRPIIHWYDGPTDIFQEMINRGYYFTFGCEVKYSKHIQNLLELTPLDKILSETDNPDSEKWLGGNSSSINLIERVVSDIANVKSIDPLLMKEIIYNNSKIIINDCFKK